MGLKQLIESGGIDAVLVKDISRITRDFLEMVKWLDWLRGNGAKLVTADGVTYEAEPIVVTALLNVLDL